MAYDDFAPTFESNAAGVDPATVRVTRVHGHEELSRCYEYVLELEVDVDGGWPDDVLDDLLRQPCVVQYGPDDQRSFLHGVLRSIRTLPTNTPRPVLYHARLVPRLWAASQVQRSRIFQELDAPGMLAAVLDEMGLAASDDYTLSLTRSYPVSEYTVQYQESDLDFVQRQLEHHGIFYYFVQEPDRERLVVADSNNACEPLEGHDEIDYTPDEGQGLAGVTELSRELTPRPAGVLLRDYNWRTPSVALQSEARADERSGRGFFNEYGQHFKDPGAGAALAGVRAEELLATRDVYEGGCRIPGLSPGHRFELRGHPLGDYERMYLVTSVEQDVRGAVEGEGSHGLSQRFTAIPYATAFRPPRRTPKPKIEGIMHARVDGEVPGTAAPIDQYGRYRILFPFDLVGEPGGRASRWVRLAQPASGPGYGIHFPLHIGVEVAVSHLDGDPDRPIIMNSPPNAETVTPVNDQNPTQSEIVTKTGIRITWDDDA